MTEIILTSVPPETLIQMANESAELAERNLRDAVQHALRAGRALVAAKAQLPHGKWMAWLRTNFDRDIGTAARYMRLADNWHSAPNIQQSESIRQALRLIAEDSRQAEPIEVVPEPVAAMDPEPVEPDNIDEPEVEPQERPTIRKVSAEARKIPEDKKPKTPEVAPVLVDETGPLTLYRQPQGGGYVMVDADKVVRVALELEDGGYVVVNSDEVMRVALELHKPMAIVRMAVLAVAPKDMSYALDELRQACKWLEQMIEEVRDGAV